MLTTTVEDIKGGFSADCSCYEEMCVIYPFEVILHLEPDGTGDAFLDCGDYQIEENFSAKNIAQLRDATVKFINDLFKEE